MQLYLENMNTYLAKLINPLPCILNPKIKKIQNEIENVTGSKVYKYYYAK